MGSIFVDLLIKEAVFILNFCLSVYLSVRQLETVRARERERERERERDVERGEKKKNIERK